MSHPPAHKHVLFICRLNRHRSATAERIFCKRKDLDVRSAGTQEDARVRVNKRMLDWAHVIFAMDDIQVDALRQMFPGHPHSTASSAWISRMYMYSSSRSS